MEASLGEGMYASVLEPAARLNRRGRFKRNGTGKDVATKLRRCPIRQGLIGPTSPLQEPFVGRFKRSGTGEDVATKLRRRPIRYGLIGPTFPHCKNPA